MKRSDLTLAESYLIHNAVLCGLMLGETTRAVRRDCSTIYDELKRGRRLRGGQYRPHRTQRRHDRAAALWAHCGGQVGSILARGI